MLLKSTDRLRARDGELRIQPDSQGQYHGRVSSKTAVTAYPGADARHRIMLEKQVWEIWHAGDHDIPSQLQRELRIGLIWDYVSAASIATNMGINRRTLDRRLAAAGSPFQMVLDEARCEYARQLLACTRLEIGKIATIVGYADPSSFTRSFKRGAGATPSSWRAKQDLNANNC
jgi:AraC-like DNA-binding protein